MTVDLSAWWRQISEYLPTWARVTGLASVAVGEGLRNLANLTHPPVDYPSVSPWGWTIFGMFIAFPCVFAWRLAGRRLGGAPDPYEAARQYIQVIKLTMAAANLSKAEQQFQWRAVMRKLADELRVGAPPPPLRELGLDAEVVKTTGQPDARA
jgi:hypothetical protein